jgi:hypothetical protein
LRRRRAIILARRQCARDAVPLASIVRSWTEASLFVVRSIGSRIGDQPEQKQQSQRSTNDRRLKDLTGLVPQSDGLSVALSIKGQMQ